MRQWKPSTFALALTLPVVGKRLFAESVGLIVILIGFLGNVSVVSPWKHLLGDQVVQPLQLNHALKQLSGKVVPFGLGAPVSGCMDEQLSPHQGPSLSRFSPDICLARECVRPSPPALAASLSALGLKDWCLHATGRPPLTFFALVSKYICPFLVSRQRK